MALSNIITGIPEIFQGFFELFKQNPLKWIIIIGGISWIVYYLFF